MILPNSDTFDTSKAAKAKKPYKVQVRKISTCCYLYCLIDSWPIPHKLKRKPLIDIANSVDKVRTQNPLK